MPLPFALPAILAKPAAKWIAAAVSLALIVLLMVLALDRFGDARYREGAADADRKWQEAAAKAQRQSEKAADKASEKAAIREADFAKRAADEKERLDETAAQGGDPFDVLFGP